MNNCTGTELSLLRQTFDMIRILDPHLALIGSVIERPPIMCIHVANNYREKEFCEKKYFFLNLKN